MCCKEVELSHIILRFVPTTLNKEFPIGLKRNDIDNIEADMFFFNDIKDVSKGVLADRPHEFFYYSLFDYNNIARIDYGTSISVIENVLRILIYTTIQNASIESSNNVKFSVNGGKFKLYKGEIYNK